MKIRTLATAALALGLSACSAVYSPVAIFGICAPPEPDATSGACLYPATCDAMFVGTPKLDVATAKLDFRLPVQIDNALLDNSNQAQGRVNTNTAFVQWLEITYSGGPYIAPQNVAVAITVPTAGSAGSLLPLLPRTAFPAVPANATVQVIMNVRAHGVLASQDSFVTAWFQVPVDVCSGCLAGNICPAGTILATCPSTAAGQGSPGQSANVACIAVTAQ